MDAFPRVIEYFGTMVLPMVTLLVLIYRGLKFNKSYMSALKHEKKDKPPYEYPPAVMGSLWRFGRVSLDDLVATIYDLSRRGYLEIREERSRVRQAYGDEVKFDYFLGVVKKDASLLPFEARVLDFVRDITERGVNSIDNFKDYAYKNPSWFTVFYKRWAKAVKHSARTYRRLTGIEKQMVITTYIFGGGLVWLALFMALMKASTWYIPMLVGLSEIFWSYYSSKQNSMGSEEFAAWSAFRNYLDKLPHEHDQEDPDQWDWDYILGMELGVELSVLEAWRKATPHTNRAVGHILKVVDNKGLNYISSLGNLTNSFSSLWESMRTRP